MSSICGGIRLLAMYSNTRFLVMNHLIKLIVIVLAVSPVGSFADKLTATLSVEPARCIALQQGQLCFADLKFKWTTEGEGEFCFFENEKSKPLICWQGNTVTSYERKIKSRKNIKYEIRSMPSNESLAQVQVKISWVYKSNNSSTSRWRLF